MQTLSNCTNKTEHLMLPFTFQVKVQRSWNMNVISASGNINGDHIWSHTLPLSVVWHHNFAATSATKLTHKEEVLDDIYIIHI